MTGLSPKSHGRVGYRDGVEWNYEHTLGGELARNGYYTQCVGKMHVHPLRKGLGFHNVELHDGYLHYYRSPSIPSYENQKVADDYFYWLKNEKGIEADVTDTGLECNSWVARPWIYEEKYHPTNWVASRSIDFLRRRDTSQPFFLMSSFVRPHAPADAPQCYFDMYRNKDLTPPVVGDWAEPMNEVTGRVFDAMTGPADPELVKEMQIGYYACITHLDHQIGRIIQALIEYKLYENTIIIFTADHGELLGDHHLFRKSRPYKGSANVPLIVAGAPALIKDKGSVREAIVELRDIFPTLLDFSEAEIPDAIEGISLVPIIRNEETTVRDYIHGEHSLGDASNHYIVTETDKYIWYSQTGKEEYFRLEQDPSEAHNAIEEEECQSRIIALREILMNELKDREEGYVVDGELVLGKTPVACLKHIL